MPDNARATSNQVYPCSDGGGRSISGIRGHSDFSPCDAVLVALVDAVLEWPHGPACVAPR